MKKASKIALNATRVEDNLNKSGLRYARIALFWYSLKYLWFTGNNIKPLINSPTNISPNRMTWTKKTSRLKEKVLYALFSLRKDTNLSKLPPLLGKKISMQFSLQFFTYNSEVWGAYIKSDLKS